MRCRLVGAAVSCLTLAGLLVTPASGQSPPDYAKADALAAAGDAAGMEQAFDEILSSHPRDRRALLGRATARSWAGKREQARKDYLALLGRSPEDVEALVGLAYDYAWAGDHAKAERTFYRALSLEPDNLAAKKGLAYGSLWSGRRRVARDRFSDVVAAHPEDADARTGLGQAYLGQGRARQARVAFDEALAIDPDWTAAHDGLEAVASAPPRLETRLGVGNSAAGGDVGLRYAEAASSMTPELRLALRYDNSLGLDNPELARSGIDAEALFLNAQHRFNEAFIGVAEIGYRDLPNGDDQAIYKLEGIFKSPLNVYKVGVQVSPHSDGYDDSLLFGGVNFPVSGRLRLETTLFVSETGAAGNQEVRGVFYGELPSVMDWTLGAGLGVGEVSSDFPEAEGSVTTAHVVASRLFSGRTRLFLAARWEESPTSEYTTFSLGVGHGLGGGGRVR